MTIAWDPPRRRMASPQRAHQLGPARARGRLDRPPPRRRAAAAGRSYRHLAPPFAGYDNRVGEPIGLASRARGRRLPGPGAVVETADGATVLDLAYVGHRIVPGKPALDGGLPATYVEADAEADTLEIDARRRAERDRGHALHTIFARPAGHRRSMRIRTPARAAATVRCGDERDARPAGRRWTLVQLTGTWARETHVVERALCPGRQSVGSLARLIGRPAQPVPRPAPRDHDRGQRRGLGCSLVYSGNFLAEAEVDAFDTTRVRIGIQPDTFAWPLEPGGPSRRPRRSSPGRTTVSVASATRSTASFASGSPAVRGATRPGPSSSTTGKRPTSTSTTTGSSRWPARRRPRRRAVRPRRRLVRPPRRRPPRRSATGSSTAQAPDGLDGVAARSTTSACEFGLWIEPEMVSADSDLFRAHPDWAIGVPGRPRTESRQQLVLDMARPEVVDHLADALSEVLASAPDLLHQVGLEPHHHRAVTSAAARRSPGRVLPSLHPRHVRPVRRLQRRVPGHPVRVVREWRRPVRRRGCWPSRRRRGPATTPTPSSAWRSSGGRRWPTR